jgi:hypothetical protein
MMTATATQSKRATYRRPWLYPQQEAAFFAPERYAVVEASSKAGKTVACMVWLTEQAMSGRAGHNFWWIAPIYAQSKIAYRRLKRALPQSVYKSNESELTLTLANGAIIWFKGAENADSLYGEDVYAAVIDEATRVREELYLAEPSDDEGNPFGIAAIRACIAPLSTDAPVAWGWDLAKSQDYTVGIALDRDRRTCRFERFQRNWEQTIVDIQQATGRTKALVDSTGVGDPILERLQKTTPNTYEGFKFTQPSKQQLMEGLAVAIQQRQVTFPDGPIVNELETFEYVYTRTGVRYSAPEGLHDDCVMGLALAVKKMERPERKWGAV